MWISTIWQWRQACLDDALCRKIVGEVFRGHMEVLQQLQSPDTSSGDEDHSRAKASPDLTTCFQEGHGPR
eukprot:m.208699 g.208699  ORF g.208699 m.208699 type:complete len:70 (-) comp10720_c0_seq2:451-660(-)